VRGQDHSLTGEYIFCPCIAVDRQQWFYRLQYRQLMKHSAILIHDTLQATSPFADAVINEASAVIVRTIPIRSPSAVCHGTDALNTRFINCLCCKTTVVTDCVLKC